MEKKRKRISVEELLERYAAGERDFSLSHLGSTCNLRGVNLSGIDLSRSYLAADLRGAILCNPNLQESALYGAIFNGASLQQANLSGADLNLTSFIGADLRSASLIKCHFDRTNLRRANLTKKLGFKPRP